MKEIKHYKAPMNPAATPAGEPTRPEIDGTAGRDEKILLSHAGPHRRRLLFAGRRSNAPPGRWRRRGANPGRGHPLGAPRNPRDLALFHHL